jgi:predicted alpha/beta hydrolase family esterase
VPRQVLFIQGGSEGAYEADAALASYLQEQLGPDYEVIYPRISGLEELKAYAQTKSELARELGTLADDALVVGHSLGGAALLKFLSEEKPERRIAGLFLAATPYFGRDGGWGNDDLAFESGFGSQLPEGTRVFLYHSRDDEGVPFDHLRRNAENLPNAAVREIGKGGHQFADGIPELIQDLKSV